MAKLSEAEYSGIEYVYHEIECSHGHKTIRTNKHSKCPECARRRSKGLPLREPHLVEVFGMRVDMCGRMLGFRRALTTY